MRRASIAAVGMARALVAAGVTLAPGCRIGGKGEIPQVGPLLSTVDNAKAVEGEVSKDDRPGLALCQSGPPTNSGGVGQV